MQYTKVQINNNISKMLEEGRSNDYALDFFLKMKMMNDLGPEQPFITKVPTPAEVRMHLLGNDVIDEDDIKLEMTKGTNCPTPRLVVRQSPACTLYAERFHDSLQVTINERNVTFMSLKSYSVANACLIFRLSYCKGTKKHRIKQASYKLFLDLKR